MECQPFRFMSSRMSRHRARELSPLDSIRRSQQPIVGIGSPVDYMGRRWVVKWIDRTCVRVMEVYKGIETGRETKVDLSVFEEIVQ